MSHNIKAELPKDKIPYFAKSITYGNYPYSVQSCAMTSDPTVMWMYWSNSNAAMYQVSSGCSIWRMNCPLYSVAEKLISEHLKI